MQIGERPRIVIIVQARMGSTRLPGKVLKQVLDKPLLGYLLERLRAVSLSTHVVVATTTRIEDDAIAALCDQEKVVVVRGSSEDVLGRYLQAAQVSDAAIIVRICADCPLIDPAVIDESIAFFLEHYPRYEIVSNFIERRYPRGYEVEVFSRFALGKAAEEAKADDEREHVTPYLYRHPKSFPLGSVVGKQALGAYRWVVDTPEDFALISHIITALYPVKPSFGTDDILTVLQTHPDWQMLNMHVQQRTVSGLTGEVYDKG